MLKALFTKLDNNLLPFFNLLWLGNLLLHNLFAGRLWIWNATSIIPPISYILFTLFLTVLSLLFYIKKLLNFDRKSILILIIFILNIALALLISDINFHALQAKPEYDEDEVITVFNLNTQFWEGPTFREDFVEFLEAKDADIYLLQEFIPYYPVDAFTFEIFHEQQIALIEEKLPQYEIAYEGEFLFLYKDNIEIINDSRVKGEYFFKIDLEIQGEIVSFYNVHIPVQFFGRNTGAAAEVKDLRDKFNLRGKAFEQLVRDVENNDNAYFIAGDFNSTKSMGVMNQMFRLGEDSIKASNTIYPATWHIGNIRLWRIDYALASKAIKFVDHQYIDSGNFSDHNGLLVKLVIR